MPRTVTLRVPNSFFDEIWALEVDTWEGRGDDESEWMRGREAFVDAWRSAKGTKRYHTVKLTQPAARYMVATVGALDNSAEHWQSGFEEPARVAAWLRTADRLEKQVREALSPQGNPLQLARALTV